ncbi:MAG: PEP-CTERM sorting domain-containing protein [Terriglobales bacterium]
MKFAKLSVILTAVLCLSSVSAFPGIIYSQPFDGIGNAYSSQNDTAGFGLFAQVYDNFTLGATNLITLVQWTGEYFNPPQQGPITGWTINFYADAAGQPGALLQSTHVNGTGDETFLGNFGGFPTYTYSVNIASFPATAGTQYWLDVYPDLAFPPQWGWSSGTGGDGISYQDFFGARGQLAADMAFDLSGGCICCGPDCVSEPGSLLLLATGLLGFGLKLRRG